MNLAESLLHALKEHGVQHGSGIAKIECCSARRSAGEIAW